MNCVYVALGIVALIVLSSAWWIPMRNDYNKFLIDERVDYTQCANLIKMPICQNPEQRAKTDTINSCTRCEHTVNFTRPETTAFWRAMEKNNICSNSRCTSWAVQMGNDFMSTVKWTVIGVVILLIFLLAWLFAHFARSSWERSLTLPTSRDRTPRVIELDSDEKLDTPSFRASAAVTTQAVRRLLGPTDPNWRPSHDRHR